MDRLARQFAKVKRCLKWYGVISAMPFVILFVGVVTVFCLTEVGSKVEAIPPAPAQTVTPAVQVQPIPPTPAPAPQPEQPPTVPEVVQVSWQPVPVYDPPPVPTWIDVPLLPPLPGQKMAVPSCPRGGCPTGAAAGACASCQRAFGGGQAVQRAGPRVRVFRRGRVRGALGRVFRWRRR